MREYLKLEHDLRRAERWCGLRPLSPDGLPFMGRHDVAQNLILATGHGHLGVALSPITGRLVGQIAAGEEGETDLRPFRVDRFMRTTSGAPRRRLPRSGGGQHAAQ